MTGLTGRRVAIFGLGYVGLVTAVAMASRGIEVVGYDVDGARVEALSSGRTPIYEPGLEELLGRAMDGGAISFTGDPADAVRGSGFVFISVGTPSREDGSMDPRYVEAAARDIGRAMRADPRYRVVVVKSTVIPGTTTGIVRSALERESGMACCRDFGLAMNPEFLREGKAIEDALRPDRVVIGEADRGSGDALEALWRSAVENDPPVLRTTPENAELIKYANNSFLAMKVSFANMFARLCMRVPGCDVDVVMRGIGMDRRIGPEFLNAGMAWGGSCFPKDLRAISSFARDRGVGLDLVEAALGMNSRGPREVAEILEEELGGLRGRRICVLGVSFKPDTDDTRESPPLRLIGELRSRGADVRACDPAARTNEVDVLRDPGECLRGADAAVLATEWAQFRGLSADAFRSAGVRLVVDTRRVYDPLEFRARGVRLVQLGRGVG
ncbi:MAG: UDP-glucose dehydrogenase family protein [Conexivisphaera sp.]